jgi:hypothetical protein
MQYTAQNNRKVAQKHIQNGITIMLETAILHTGRDYHQQ